jgi:hypothetical protein
VTGRKGFVAQDAIWGRERPERGALPDKKKGVIP